MAKTTPTRTAPLTPKQQRFVQEYLQDHNGTQAAIRTGYSAKTAKQQGSRLLAEPRIQAAVKAGQQKVAKKAEVTVDSLMAELEQARKLALKEKLASAAVTATMGKGKLAGLLVEKHKHSGAIGTYDLKNLSDDDLDRLEQILGPLADAGGDPGGAGEEGG
ncbi:terminase small subunit [Mesorhizobium sp. M00.F.Ca.ET.151.01.1.1]|nr:terminase small subunit [bacterium M00.F.Ca.ET.199.01.1.1]TGT08758.1 terminase small subunit [bacterium M00.F.Ca.ET.177.01.1.1]TGT66692.1 terminase small subunit [Mesorhizobium sp. M00.F.Ca.ET.170.01.1.1]TGU15605.1 terminase small subunit [bacterium M00.F.Ca.ET.163.01.1.1]TGU98331.1 terminase small subunit [Mesorhizobium sp. M00.F.Ca.ET.151.01.1.1]TGV59997.1 terminase small subunit [bacterium M00.F.Ca.ET.141.01.1.1]